MGGKRRRGEQEAAETQPPRAPGSHGNAPPLRDPAVPFTILPPTESALSTRAVASVTDVSVDANSAEVPDATPSVEPLPAHLEVTVPTIDKNTFESWDDFHAYLTEYQRRTFQVYSIRTATPVSTRNKRIKEKYERRGQDVPPGELLPEAMGAYSKAVVCTHYGRPRSRSTGARPRQRSRAIMCPAQITLVLRRDFATGRCLVHVSSHRARHNHALSDGLYREHPRVRKVTDPAVLRTVEALQQAEVAPAKILQYVRDNTDKQVLPRDVHNLLAMLRKGGSPPASVAPPFRLRESGSASSPPTSTSPLAPSRVATCTATSTAAVQLSPATQVAVTPQPSGQYAKFLAAFDVAKQLSEALASMSAERFEHGLAELGMFLRIAESGRQPIVTTREAVKHVQRQAVQEAVLSGPQPSSASDSRSVSSNAASNSDEPAAGVVEPSTVTDDVHSRVNSEESEQEREL